MTPKTMKLFLSDQAPSLAVRMLLKALDDPVEFYHLDFDGGEQGTKTFLKISPQEESPVLADDGLCINESIPVMKYIVQKFAPNSSLYPREIKARALVNERLQFNMGYFYHGILDNILYFIYIGGQRTFFNIDKTSDTLDVFETYLKREKTKYAAGNTLTIADFPLILSVACVEAVNFQLDDFPLLSVWYQTFKDENPELWKVAEVGMRRIHLAAKKKQQIL